jgi:hypothetical protein
MNTSWIIIQVWRWREVAYRRDDFNVEYTDAPRAFFTAQNISTNNPKRMSKQEEKKNSVGTRNYKNIR